MAAVTVQVARAAAVAVLKRYYVKPSKIKKTKEQGVFTEYYMDKCKVGDERERRRLLRIIVVL